MSNIVQRLLTGVIALVLVTTSIPVPNAFASTSSQTISIKSYIEKVNREGNGWVTYNFDKDGTMVSIETIDELEPSTEHSLSKSARGIAVTIAVYVGSAVVGYVICSVIDGVIISVSGQSGAAWVATAISRLKGRPVPAGKRIYLSCNVYPPHSMEYIRCSRA